MLAPRRMGGRLRGRGRSAGAWGRSRSFLDQIEETPLLRRENPSRSSSFLRRMPCVGSRCTAVLRRFFQPRAVERPDPPFVDARSDLHDLVDRYDKKPNAFDQPVAFHPREDEVRVEVAPDQRARELGVRHSPICTGSSLMGVAWHAQSWPCGTTSLRSDWSCWVGVFRSITPPRPAATWPRQDTPRGCLVLPPSPSCRSSRSPCGCTACRP